MALNLRSQYCHLFSHEYIPLNLPDNMPMATFCGLRSETRLIFHHFGKELLQWCLDICYFLGMMSYDCSGKKAKSCLDRELCEAEECPEAEVLSRKLRVP
jgi:hypothetical protein